MKNDSNNEMRLDEVSLSDVQNEAAGVPEAYEGEVELISDMGEIEELSQEAKERQKQAIGVLRDKVLTTIDTKKLPMAVKLLGGIERFTELLTKTETWESIEIKSAMDLKFAAEAQRIMLQNMQTLTQMASINTEGDAGDFMVGLEFGKGSNKTKVVVKRGGGNG